MLLVACNSKRTPKGILEPAPMQDVLWDMLVAGEFLNGYVLLRDTGIHRLVKSNQVYGKVLALHKIDQETFDKSITWYREHPQLMKEVLDSMAARHQEKSDLQPLPQVPAIDPGNIPPVPVDTSLKKMADKVPQQGVLATPPPR